MSFTCTICCERLAGAGAGPSCCIPCGHCFHNTCLRLWLESPNNRTCPQCRKVTIATDIRLLTFTESPENEELDQKFNELSLGIQAENVALQALTDNILQLSEQVAFIQENDIALMKSNQINGEMIGKIYTQVIETQQNSEKILGEPWSTISYSILAIFSILLVCPLLFWTVNGPSTLDFKPCVPEPCKPVPCKPIAITFGLIDHLSTPHVLTLDPAQPGFNIRLNIRQPSGLNPSYVAQLLSELQSAKPDNTPKSSFSIIADTMQMLYNFMKTDSVSKTEVKLEQHECCFFPFV